MNGRGAFEKIEDKGNEEILPRAGDPEHAH